MATARDIEKHYDTVGALHALRMIDVQGNFPDYTCAFYDGDTEKSYVQAQQDKHRWIFEGLGLKNGIPGKRILDIGCGWGPILNAAQMRNMTAVGLTLASGQVAHGKKYGVDIRLRDYKALLPGEFDVFDAVISIGAFEHFCSVDEMLRGEQMAVYRNFFRIWAENLSTDGGLFLQTMTWGKTVPDYRRLSLNAPKDSPEAILARMEYLYPGSWLPNSLEQIVECASPYFEFVSHSNGRLDYIETLKGWDKATHNLWKPRHLPRTICHAVPIVYNALTDNGAWIQLESIRRGDQRQCFEREIMSHERIFFKKKAVH